MYTVNIEVQIMPRRDDIPHSFRQAIKLEPSGRRTVTTEDFVAELSKRNWRFSLSEANAWIKYYARNFKDISDVEGEQKTWFMYNPNGGI